MYPAIFQNPFPEIRRLRKALRSQKIRGLLERFFKICSKAVKSLHSHFYAKTILPCFLFKASAVYRIQQIVSANGKRHLPGAVFIDSSAYQIVGGSQTDPFQIRTVKQRKIFDVIIGISHEIIKNADIPELSLILY